MMSITLLLGVVDERDDSTMSIKPYGLSFPRNHRFTGGRYSNCFGRGLLTEVRK
jgi:hypothetical protein